jgi:hypothetical protein
MTLGQRLDFRRFVGGQREKNSTRPIPAGGLSAAPVGLTLNVMQAPDTGLRYAQRRAIYAPK